MKTLSIMVVEDNETMRLGIMESLRREKYQLCDFSDGVSALEHFEKKPTELVITDLKMEPLDGLELLKRLKAIKPATEILMISAYGTVDIAVKAMQEGATDFLTKPFSPDELRIRIRRIVEKIQQRETIELLVAEKQMLEDHLGDRYEEMIGQSPAMKKIFGLIERVARQDTTVLIEGESGTGKELVARAIHRKSSRTDNAFIRMNCGALNENLLESELFGHEKGAFTGALRQKRGRFELADGGTLFLDEIGDISAAMQMKLLRVLQEQELERVGGEETISVDVRIICATNKNLNELVSKKVFREDLFYRLSVIPIRLPSLRERREDIPLLAKYILDKLSQNRPEVRKEITTEGIHILQEYSWPGNIRELENVIERLIVISQGNEISPQLIARQLDNKLVVSDSFDGAPLNDALYTFEKNLILHALKQAGGVKNRAARFLGIKTSTLYYKMEKFGILK